MEDRVEVLVTSDESGHLWNCCVWDYTNGTTLKVLKTGVSAPRTLNVVAGEYFISAEFAKPIINVWSVLQKGQLEHAKFVSPGKVSVLLLTPDSAFCVAAIQENLFIWQVCTGELLTTVRHHYNQIKCLKMTDEGSHLVSAADDNMVCVWKMARLIRTDDSSLNKVEPLFSWSDSSLPVTDVYVGNGGRKARVVTVSLDRTCRLYSLRSGELLISIVFDVSLTTVVMDPAEFYIFVGGNEGSIFTVQLIEPPPTVRSHISDSDCANNVFVGHSKRITALATTSNGQLLISGSEDKMVKIWDVSSKQCIRNLAHRGVITNVLVVPALTAFTSTSTSLKKHSFIVKPFKHNLVSVETGDGVWKHSANIRINQSSAPLLMDDTLALAKELLYQKDDFTKTLIKEVEELQKQNSELYQTAVEAARN